jgi:hypothetical protein
MTYEEFKSEMDLYRQNADRDASSRKDSQLVLDRLYSLYGRFEITEREMANRVLADWALSTDEGLRFDALALIDEFEVWQAVPALRELAVRLEGSEAPSAPYELEKVQRILGNLT